MRTLVILPTVLVAIATSSSALAAPNYQSCSAAWEAELDQAITDIDDARVHLWSELTGR